MGAHIVSTILKSFGYSVHLYLFPNKNKPKIIQIPDELTYLKDFLIQGEVGPSSYFTTYKRFGPDYSSAAEAILANSPDIVFISCFAFCYALSTIRLAEELKKKDKKIPIVLGGAGAAVFPEYFERTGLFDSVLKKEAEQAIPKFFGKDKRFNLIPCVVNTKNTKKFSYYSTYLTRGCPNGCGFCSVALVHGKRIREVDNNSLLKLLPRMDDSKVFLFNFEDDNILFRRKFFIETLKRIKKIIPNIMFSCENGIDYRLLDEDCLNGLISLGFRQFNFSIGTACKKIAKKQNRPTDISLLKSLLQVLNKKQIDTIVYFIAGFPDEKIEDAVLNLILLMNLGENVRIGLSLFYPVPGISGFEDLDMFKDLSPSLLCSTSAWPWNKSLSTMDMITLFRLVRLVNLSKRKELDSFMRDFIKRCVMEKRLYTLIKGSPHPVEVRCYNREMVRLFFDGLNKPLWS
ncbi:hypothetical protein JCM13304A_02820 [Desulfothermus okinawensis JCM 13304]